MIASLFKKKSKKIENNSSELLHENYFNGLRSEEFNRLDREKQVYLDYTGGNLYPEKLLKSHFALLEKHTFGNPHSTNPTSQRATKLVEGARQKVLDFFSAPDYYCIFTANASGALKIVGENYPFEEEGYFMLLSDSHNSVNGIREYCKNRGGQFSYSPIQAKSLRISEEELNDHLRSIEGKNKLFAFPAQSNVSGVKHDLGWIEKAQSLGWDVLLDAAAFVPTSKLDLSKHKPDFVSVSFYKIFGYPTGLGCLLVRKESFDKLHKRWFAGGTVSLASVMAPHHFLQNNHERFEDGTLNYLDIPAIQTGLEFIEEVGLERLGERLESLMNYLVKKLSEQKHSSGQNQVALHGDSNRQNMGSTLLLSFLNPDGSKMPFEIVENKANEKGISIRSGCFCNPGIDEINNCLTTNELAQYFSGREWGHYSEMIDCLQKMRGATRVSIGVATTKDDLDTFVDFVKSLKDQSL